MQPTSRTACTRRFAELRRRQPVYWSPSLGYWLITSYELVEEVLRNPADYSSFGAEGSYIHRLPPDVVELSATTLVHHFQQPGLIHSDGAKHSELRRAVNPPFATRGAGAAHRHRSGPGRPAPRASPDVGRAVRRRDHAGPTAPGPGDRGECSASPPRRSTGSRCGPCSSPASSPVPNRNRTSPAISTPALVEWRHFVAELIDTRTRETRRRLRQRRGRGDRRWADDP